VWNTKLQRYFGVKTSHIGCCDVHIGGGLSVFCLPFLVISDSFLTETSTSYIRKGIMAKIASGKCHIRMGMFERGDCIMSRL